MKNKVSFNSGLAKFGIGLFETIKVNNEPIELDLHLDRIFKSIDKLNLSIDYSKNELRNEITNYIEKNNIVNKAIRLTIFDEGYNISSRDIPYTKKSYENGFKLNISPIKRGDSEIHRHKTTNYYESIYTKAYANEKGYDDGIFTNLNEIILECSMSNIYFIKDNKIITPNSKLPILNGTTKRRIIEICGELNIQIKEMEIKLSEIGDFDFVFISNSLIGVMKIIEIEGIKYNKENYLYDKVSQRINLVVGD
ncbi:MAG: aminotransferase class IV [Romboutsia sp.]|uniref:aminotransferase class IV n=1 Tax=Romboutsia sp. TaxID=1965302 RepID=UPI003F2F7E11